MTAAIDITAAQRKTLLGLLRRYIPGIAVWAYGSRVKWTARPNSDLDLVAFTKPEQRYLVSELKEALNESSLPFLVDLHIGDDVPERFHEIIRNEYVVLQEEEEKRLGDDIADKWETVPLASLYDFGSGLSKPREEFGFGHGFLSFKDVFHNYFVPESLSQLVNSTEKEQQTCSINRGDVFLTRTSETMDELGMSCVALKNYEGATFNGFTKRLRPKATKKIVPEYAGYYFRSPKFRRDVTAMSSLSTRASLNNEMLARLTIDLPPVEIQAAIGSILKALDDKIDLNRRMNATLEEMARALFQSWFVDFDPVRAKLDGRQPVGLDAATAALFPAHFEDSPLGRIPQGWNTKDLGELAEIDKGLSYKGGGLAEDGGMPMVNLGCFTGRGLFSADRVKRYIGEYRDRHLVRAGDLVIANTDMTQNRVIIGSPALVPELDGEKEFLFTHHVFTVRFKPGADVWRRYIYFTLLKPEFREIAEGYSTGTTVLALPRDGLMNYSLCLPPLPLLDAFEMQVGPLLDAVNTNIHQSRTLAILRDTLLPRLLNGEVAVS